MAAGQRKGGGRIDAWRRFAPRVAMARDLCYGSASFQEAAHLADRIP